MRNDYAIKRCSLVSTYGHHDVWAVFAFDGQLYHVALTSDSCMAWVVADMGGEPS